MDISGIFPVLPTPFHADGAPDEAALRRLVRYALASGVDGVTYPGVASEVSELAPDERVRLVAAVQDELAGRRPLIVGISGSSVEMCIALGRSALECDVAAFMVAAPADRKDVAQQIGFFSALGAALRVPIMLQNVPPPAGAGLAPDTVVGILQAVPAIAYVKEETLPSGQRLTALRERAPATLRGVFGGAGGRYVTDELRRGAAGSMPAIELAEVHAALMAAHRAGDAAAVRRLFTRMLPVLNVQAVFRWALTKYVLQRRGLLDVTRQRAAGPTLDAADRVDVDAFLDDIADLLLPGDAVP
ncbi:MAG TPA: dihydrodipicolinate synthase family protein [Casimicrobiaceae bacterium]